MVSFDNVIKFSIIAFLAIALEIWTLFIGQGENYQFLRPVFTFQSMFDQSVKLNLNQF